MGGAPRRETCGCLGGNSHVASHASDSHHMSDKIHSLLANKRITNKTSNGTFVGYDLAKFLNI
jgi:hypothetical protein